MKLTFNPENHEYRVDGRIVLSVTQILKRLNLDDFSMCAPGAAQLGSDVHAQINEYILKGSMDIDARGSSYAYRAALFLQHVDEVIVSEQPLYCKEGDYVGTIDLVCVMNGRRWLLDWKLNQAYASAFPQLAAYCNMWNSNQRCSSQMIEKRGVVVLSKTGYELIDAEDRNLRPNHQSDWPTFLKALEASKGSEVIENVMRDAG